MSDINIVKSVYQLKDFTVKDNSDEDLYVKNCWGYSIKNGKVFCGMGFSPVTFPITPYYDATEEGISYSLLPPELTKLEVVAYFKGYDADTQAMYPFDRRVFFRGSDNLIYEFRPTIDYHNILNIFSTTLIFNSCPIALNYLNNGVDTIIFSSESDPLIVWSCTKSSPQTMDLSLRLTSMCENDDALYATTTEDDAKIVWYTTSLDPLDFEDETSTTKGTITLGDERGPCKKVISFKGYVYVFRDFGITRLAMLANGEHSISQLYQSPSKIYANTVAVCGDKILFLTRSGFCEFNGISVDPLDIQINSLVDDINNEKAIGVSLHDKYYVACTADFNDDNQIGVENNATYLHNAFISIDINDNTTNVVRGIDISNMLAIKDLNMEKLVVTFNGSHTMDVAQLDNSGKFFTTDNSKSFSTNTLKLEKEKTISKIEIDCSLGTIIDITTDNGNIHFVATKEGNNYILPFVKTKNIMLTVTANTIDNSWINDIKLTISEIV